MIRPMLFAAALAAALPTVAAAELQRVTSKSEFLSIVEGRTLSALFVNLRVTPEGGIDGSAFGRDVTGRWAWQGNYFCREMQAGDRSFENDCQIVQTDGQRIRFIGERGQGDMANLNLR
ncbi:dihydrodipicolinate reductase [Rhodovulum sp. YNF3179]|uniref:dihydrodipicolinate reductase n=1 Tax=Rhodovulum sp. YNF3179 TaxID=3425127 RepID=UPI003D34290A